jgi:hypothetical protein
MCLYVFVRRRVDNRRHMSVKWHYIEQPRKVYTYHTSYGSICRYVILQQINTKFQNSIGRKGEKNSNACASKTRPSFSASRTHLQPLVFFHSLQNGGRRSCTSKLRSHTQQGDSTNFSRYRLEMPDLSNSNLRAEVDLAVVAEAALVGGKPKTHSTWPFLLR